MGGGYDMPVKSDDGVALYYSAAIWQTNPDSGSLLHSLFYPAQLDTRIPDERPLLPPSFPPSLPPCLLACLACAAGEPGTRLRSEASSSS